MSGGHPISEDRSGAKTVTQMTAYEIVMVIIGILALLISFGGFMIALLAFLDKRNKRK
ncbi:putative holin-like toxin [Clostridium sp. AN503]|uniref:putative holin-like toxin n=1 Tax=Clostridium sp. AN503 TaxID=3160598 RepID=UPI003459704C